ncbi:Uncharacterized protein T12_5077 [Trichinella patagoniensis]|uniref:Apple domain-containing protein n=1 Tax=Trichinella patagoniensis TaxID=990121 RepID=A0A0V0ZBF0_9BILA|nr:Uncharacterized protein T12_5077 [Trichinella patagoniensis]
MKAMITKKMSRRIRNVNRVDYAELCRNLGMMDDDEDDDDYTEGDMSSSSISDDSTSLEENDHDDEDVNEAISSNLDNDPQWVMCRKVGEQWTSKEFKVFEGELAAEMNFRDRPLMEKKNRQFIEWNSDFAVYNEQRNQWTDEVVRFIHEIEELNNARRLEIQAKTVTDPENCKTQLLYLCREMARDGVKGVCDIPKNLNHNANTFYRNLMKKKAQTLLKVNHPKRSLTTCFSSMKPNLIQPTSVMRYSTQSECLQACRSVFPPPSRGQLNLLFPPPSSAVIPESQPETKTNEKCLVNYFVVAKSELDAEPDSDTAMVTEIGDENTCIAKCTREESCQSFTALLTDKVCILTSNQAVPTGKCRLSYYEDAVYFEKFHLCADIANSCSEQFFYTFHDTTLDTPTIETTKTKSLEQCANDCVDNNQCKAAVFNKLKKRCFLKAETAVDQPSALTECRGSYYFENGCRSGSRRHNIRMNDPSGRAFDNKKLQLIKKQPTDQWTSWSSCQFEKDGQRFRSRSRRNWANGKLSAWRKIQYKPC